MTRDEYWALIDRTRNESGGALEAHTTALKQALDALSPEDIIDFERHSEELLHASYQDHLWGAAYLINGGCSDDGFDYFRGWLIAQGRPTYEAALANPDSLADCPALGDGDVELESLWYIARNTYEAKTGNTMPDDVGAQTGEIENGTVDFDFDDDEAMSKHYPRLFARFAS